MMRNASISSVLIAGGSWQTLLPPNPLRRSLRISLAGMEAGNTLLGGGNEDITILPLAARTSQQIVGPFVNNFALGIIVYLRVTAASGTGGLYVILEGVDPVSGQPEFLNAAPAAVTTTTGNLFIYMLYPGLTALNEGQNVKQVMSGVLPKTWQFRMNVGDASSYTYSVGATLLQPPRPLLGSVWLGGAPPAAGGGLRIGSQLGDLHLERAETGSLITQQVSIYLSSNSSYPVSVLESID